MERAAPHYSEKHMMAQAKGCAHDLSPARVMANTAPGIYTAPETCGDTGHHTPRPSPCFPVNQANGDGGIGGERTLVLERSDASLSVGGLWMWMTDGLGYDSGSGRMFGFERLSLMASVHRDKVNSSIHHMDHDTHGFPLLKVARLELPRSPLRL
jgi:hypothetical protein